MYTLIMISLNILLGQLLLKKEIIDRFIIVLNEGEKLRLNIYNQDGDLVGDYSSQKPESESIESFIKSIVLNAISSRLVGDNSKVGVFLHEGVIQNYSSILFILEVDRILFKIGRFRIQELVKNEEVINTIIDLARQIGYEGREGKKVGTMFVIGDYKELKPYLKQLILNPFYGYPDELSTVSNKEVRETIKELASIDGAFIISNDGLVISAGTYIDVPRDSIPKDVKIYSGWGTRHLAAVGITSVTNSVAVLVSESGGVVKVFKKGKLILKINPS